MTRARGPRDWFVSGAFAGTGALPRRHHRERMIRRGRRMIDGALWTNAEKDAWALRNHDHMAECSCVYCLSQRKVDRGWQGLTLQERRQLLASEDDARSEAGAPTEQP